MIPIFAIVFARLILGEAITARSLAGGSVILAGVLVIATEKHAGKSIPVLVESR